MSFSISLHSLLLFLYPNHSYLPFTFDLHREITSQNSGVNNTPARNAHRAPTEAAPGPGPEYNCKEQMCSVLVTLVWESEKSGGKFQLRRGGVWDGERETQVQKPPSQERVQHVRETERSRLECRQQRRDGERRYGRRLARTRSWKLLDLLKENFSCGKWETLNVISEGWCDQI